MENIFFSQAAFYAFLFGILSAVSLPLGAWVGILIKPSERLTASIMAYGAGALLAALTLELVAEALEKLQGGFWPIGLGCAIGGFIFVALNYAISNKGGFLRKTATLAKHATKLKRKRIAEIIEYLSHVPLFNSLPPEEIHSLVVHVHERNFKQGTRIITEGEDGFELYIIEKGSVEVSHQGEIVATLGPSEIFGEMALLTNEVRQATVTAVTDVMLLEIHKSDFDRLLQASPQLKQEVQNLYDAHLKGLELIRRKADSRIWAEKVERFTEEKDYKPSASEIYKISKEHIAHKGAPLAILIGTFMDGMPESFVIGVNTIGSAKIGLSLIVGIFLANFPESMSSSIGMKKMGISGWKIMGLWGLLCVLSGIGAYLGNIMFQEVPPYTVAFIESLAAGAMLAMIAETMLPEAFEQGGSVVGMSTIFGFLSAIFVKTIEA
ncbi:MAG: cyclic nucleotide-binding domain-containing protein [Nitrospirae bacterium]|nr:cyclic nucleotide-binding domain-containing protein [Nitrospirota bacterium]MCL5978406.1 cyclic nucleotide-binding domain-containing protein [Nitrospirota bacterium]